MSESYVTESHSTKQQLRNASKDVQRACPLLLSSSPCRLPQINRLISSLCADEPTSGLDSYTSNEVMRTVKQLATGGVTVCATIHSPTAYCFSLFDRLLMLVQGSGE